MVYKPCLPAGDSEGYQRAVARHGKKMFSALTFNMQNGQVWDEENPDQAEVSLSRAIEFLREQDADVVFLQEVERGYDGGQQIEPPPHYERLKNDLAEYDSVFSYPRPNRMEIPFGLGLAIFSKTALRNFYRKDLPPAEIAFEFGGCPAQTLSSPYDRSGNANQWSLLAVD